jgi:hypothetical protein
MTGPVKHGDPSRSRNFDLTVIPSQTLEWRKHEGEDDGENDGVASHEGKDF